MKVHFWKTWNSSPQNESQRKYGQSELLLINWISITFKICLLCIFIIYVPWIRLVITTRVARLGTTLGLLVGLRMLPELFAPHQVCDKIISCDYASKTFGVDSKGGNEAGRRSTYH
jgi:hypothetical protein